MLWQIAEPTDPVPTTSPQAWLAELRHDVGQLRANLGPNQHNACDAVLNAATRLWGAFQQAWMGEEHRAQIAARERSEPEAHAQVMAFEGTAIAKPMNRYLAATARLLNVLSGEDRLRLLLGAAVAALGFMMDTDAETPIRNVPGEVRQPIAAIRAIVAEMARLDPELASLDWDLSLAHHVQAGGAEAAHVSWVRERLQQLLPAICVRLMHAERSEAVAVASADAATTSGDDEWISSSAAADFAASLGISLEMSQITKMCKEEDCPFRFRTPRKGRRDLHSVTFLQYIYKRHLNEHPIAETEAERVAPRLAEAESRKKRLRGDLG
jgi:hypothetical protein